MSGFFEPPPLREPEPEPEQPPWIGPPENELGVPVPLRLLLARTDDVAVALVDVAAYSTGLEFRMEVRLRAHDELVDPFGMQMRHPRRAAEAGIPDEVLRFGFELPDGRRVTNISPFPHAEEAQEGPVLMQRGGGGGGRSWSFGYWLWPLPPSGRLAVVVEWPSQGIDMTRVEVDADPLLAAAAQSERLWPHGGASSGGGWTGYGPVA
jgi:hypothetical protein